MAFSRPTTFIIGAGASCELGLPTGIQLKDEVSSLLNILFPHGYEQQSGDFQIAEILRREAQSAGNHDWNYLLYKAWHIRDALPGALSIDNVLDAMNSDSDLVYCGKLAISKAILAGERRSKLYRNASDDRISVFQRCAGTYLIPLFQMITESVRKNRLEDLFENLSIITFNYDRSIERFLPEALATYYGIPESDADDIVLNANIIHPYGHVGALKGISQNDAVWYGVDSAPIDRIAGEIRTFTEGLAETELQNQVHRAYANSEVLVFLGFAFHPINMQILDADRIGAAKKIVGTAYGFAKPARSVAENLIMQSLSKVEIGSHWAGQRHDYVDSIDLDDSTAFDLLNAHFRGIV
jgi:hypothetical protein